MRSFSLRFTGFCIALVIAAASAATPPAASHPQLVSQIVNGDLLWAAGKLDEAEKTFAYAFKVNPKSADAGMKLAGIRLSRQNYSGAIEIYQRVIGVGTPNAKAWIGMGLAYMHTGQPDLTRAAFEEAVRIEPARKQDLDLLIAKTER